MSVTVKRNTGWMGTASRISVKLNEEKIEKIANNQQIRLNLPDSDDEARLKVTQFGAKSNEIIVTDGDTVEITTTKWSYTSFFLLILYIPLINIVAISAYRTIVFIVVLIMLISSFFLLDSYRLKITSDRSEYTS